MNLENLDENNKNLAKKQSLINLLTKKLFQNWKGLKFTIQKLSLIKL